MSRDTSAYIGNLGLMEREMETKVEHQMEGTIGFRVLVSSIETREEPNNQWAITWKTKRKLRAYRDIEGLRFGVFLLAVIGAWRNGKDMMTHFTRVRGPGLEEHGN